MPDCVRFPPLSDTHTLSAVIIGVVIDAFKVGGSVVLS